MLDSCKMISPEDLENLTIPELKDQAPAILNGLVAITRQTPGEEVLIEFNRGEADMGGASLSKKMLGVEILYYVLRPLVSSTLYKAFKAVSLQTDLDYFQAYGISFFKPPEQVPILVAGRPSLPHNLFKGDKLLIWTDSFKAVRSTKDPHALEDLLEQYCSHGPSLVYTRSIHTIAF